MTLLSSRLAFSIQGVAISICKFTDLKLPVQSHITTKITANPQMVYLYVNMTLIYSTSIFLLSITHTYEIIAELATLTKKLKYPLFNLSWKHCTMFYKLLP